MLVAVFFLNHCCTKSCSPVYSKFSGARLTTQNTEIENHFLLLQSTGDTVICSKLAKNGVVMFQTSILRTALSFSEAEFVKSDTCKPKGTVISNLLAVGLYVDKQFNDFLDSFFSLSLSRPALQVLDQPQRERANQLPKPSPNESVRDWWHGDRVRELLLQLVWAFIFSSTMRGTPPPLVSPSTILTHN